MNMPDGPSKNKQIGAGFTGCTDRGGGKPRVRSRRKSAIFVSILVSFMMVASGTVLALHDPSAPDLSTVGPISSVDTGGNGYPVWYRDAHGTDVELCLDFSPQSMCGFVGNEINPNLPLSFPDNFPGESFWWSGEAALDSTTQSALLVMAVEATFASGEVAIDGDQVSFGRVRIRLSGLKPGEVYTVTHPYGVRLVTAEPDGSVFVTQDIGGITAPADFSQTLDSPVLDGLLEWDAAPGEDLLAVLPDLTGPDGVPDGIPDYLGNPDVPHTVTGSRHLDSGGIPTNYFKIEGPADSFLGFPAEQDCSIDSTGVSTHSCILSDQFSIMGKRAVTSGVEAVRAAYVNPGGTAPGYVEVHAKSRPGQTLQVSGLGIGTVAMQGSGDAYYAKILIDNVAFLDDLVVTNISDGTWSPVVVTDLVTITRAEYQIPIPPSGTDPGTPGKLIIEATSSDSRVITNGGLAYEPAGLDGNFAPLSTVLTVSDVASAPLNVTVTSSAGGSDTEPVRLVGADFTRIGLPIVAKSAPPLVVIAGETVTLDGSLSEGDITNYQWRQINVANPPGVNILQVETDPTATFVAPSTAGVLHFELSVTGIDATGLRTVTTTTEVTVSSNPPHADAGAIPANASAYVGEIVTLDGSRSTFATNYLWTQVSGPDAIISGSTQAVASFTMPALDKLGSPVPLVFKLAVRDSANSLASEHAVEVTIIQKPDAITRVVGLFRESKDMLRIEGFVDLYDGTSSVFQTANLVTVYVDTGPGFDPSQQVIGTAVPDHFDGSWNLRVKDLPPMVKVDIVSSRDGYEEVVLTVEP